MQQFLLTSSHNSDVALKFLSYSQNRFNSILISFVLSSIRQYKKVETSINCRQNNLLAERIVGE